MATTPTQKPIPSEDVRDFKFNIGKTDQFITSNEFFYTDRFGVKRYTAEGIRHFLAPLGTTYTPEQADAAIASGEIPNDAFFFIWSDNDEYIAEKYQNVGGVATPQDSFIISNEFIRSRVPDTPSPNDYTPIVIDEDNNVGLWFENGLLNAKGIHDDINPIIKVDSGNYRVPFVFDEDNNVALWFENGLLNAKGLAPSIAGVNKSELSSYFLSKTNATNGETLWQYNSKKGKLDLGTAAKLTIGFPGDSWCEHATIPQVFANYLYGKYGKAGEGWIQLNIDKDNLINGVTLTKANWSVYDASETTSDPTYPTSMDGQYLFSSATNSTIILGNLFATSVQIVYYDGNGSFNYSVNSGSSVNVVGTGTNKIVTTTITGLGISSATQISISTSNNAGTVVIYSFYASGSGNGVEIAKMGNGGITAPGYTKVLPYLPQTAGIVAPDLLIMIIGTNDYRLSVPVTDFTTGLMSWVQAWKTAIPNAGIILVAPPQANATGVYPLSSYRDAMRSVASQLGVEFFSMYDFLNVGYSKSNAAGLWIDNLHLNSNGARYLFNQLNKKILGV
ncbi:SGNH/GDSL hydrolase family protein [Serratia marcescens]|uniref:SGNH/GDSL hydrolase family protein n=1 Tax=Serratia marcescens TaxID=615 RepID=UPI001F14FB74|nr:GDSL-type esterase/lipase family protein [Serratia marcescens]